MVAYPRTKVFAVTARNRIKLSKLMPLAPIVISVFALSVSILEAIRGQNFRQTSLAPLVFVTSGVAEDEKLYLEIQNTGLGPAKIKWYLVYLDGVLMSSPQRLAEGLKDELSSNKVVFRLLTHESSISPQDTRRTFEVQIRNQGFAPLDRIQQVICYCSVFDDCVVASDVTQYERDGSKKIGSKQGQITLPTCDADVVHPQYFGMPN